MIDVGTSHVDGVRGAAVNAAISYLGITRIIVAYRKEKIASADRVFKLENMNLSSFILSPPTNSCSIAAGVSETER